MSGTRAMHLATDPGTCERVLAALDGVVDLEHAAVSTSIADSGEYRIDAYFEAPPDETLLREAIRAATDDAVADTVVFADVAARDWVAASLVGLAPVHAGRFVVHGAHDRARVPPNAIGIEIEAALAFGTGHHGTTRGCLLALAALAKRGHVDLARRPRPGAAKRGARVLDVGTGTAVLAIAAARLLRSPVLASDIDPVAIRVARGNARANGAAPLIAFVCAAGAARHRLRRDAPYDLIFANILLGPLRRMARPLAALLAPRGRLVLSGLLPAHAGAALSAYRTQGLVLETRLTLEGWTTLVLSRA